MRILAGGAIAVGIWQLHRALQAMERRGWIFYTKQSRPPGMAANALIHLEAIVNPPAEHVIEIRRVADLWNRQTNGQGSDLPSPVPASAPSRK